jgi:hypothetical protein
MTLSMQQMDPGGLTETYCKLNSSFPEKFVFQFGRGGGFGAEMIHLLCSVAACLQHKFQFCLGQCRNPRGFAIKTGWNDYFEPIFPTVPGRLLHVLNRGLFPFNRVPIAKILSRLCLRVTYGTHYRFLFDQIGPTTENFTVPALAIEAGYWDGFQMIAEAIWRLRADVIQRVEAYRTAAALPAQYVAAHVRRGDKISEAPYIPVETYLHPLRDLELSGTGKPYLYLATDDLRVVDTFRETLTGWDIANVSPVHTVGYDQAQFNSLSPEERWEWTVFFLFELEVLKNADWFLGAPPTNVYFLTRYRRANRRIIHIQSDPPYYTLT